METQLFVGISEEKKIRFKTKLAEKGHTAKNIINLAVDDYLTTNGKPKWLKKT